MTLASGTGSRAGTFAAEVAEYLQRTPRQLPSKYFYDELGSSLFDAICRLPWYRITRAESALLARHAREILAPLRTPFGIAELGCGNGEKLAVLLEHAGAGEGGLGRRSLGGGGPDVQLVDISAAALAAASARLAGAARSVVVHQSSYQDGLSRVHASRAAGSPMMVLFLGSNIGNFDRGPAHELLRAIRATLISGDALLVGTDLIKPERDLLLAYDDPLQVTAAFNRNLLRRINDELGGTFRLECFGHRAVWNAGEGRVEMHLVSRRPQVVRIAAAALTVAFDTDEWIWTESSYKYHPAEVVASGLAAGFTAAGQWVDEDARFAVTRFSV